MRYGWVALIAAIGVAGWCLFDLGLAPSSVDIWPQKGAPAATIPDPATTYSDAQLLSAGKESFDVFAHSYYGQPIYIPRSLTYVRFAFNASVVDKPFPLFYFTNASVPVDTWMLETDVVVKPATLNHIFASAQSLPCASNSNDLKQKGGDLFDVQRRGSDGILRRCLVSKAVGCTLLRRTENDLMVFDTRRKGDLDEITELRRRMSCSQGVF